MAEHEDAGAPLAALGEALGSCTYECDPTGAVLVASPRLAALLGPGATLDALCAPADRERVRAARVGALAGARLELSYALAAGGAARDVALARATQGGVRLVGVIDDDRERRRREATLAADARADALSELAGGVAHEINNPLSGVLNYAQLASRYPPGDPRLAEALEGILSEGRRVLEVTRALGTFGRSKAPRSILVGDLLRAAVALVRRELRDDLINIAHTVAEDLPPVMASGNELQLVLRDAIGWARRALRARPGRRSLTLRAQLSAADDVELEVGDAAHGVALAAQGDLEVEVEVERARAVLARHGGRFEVVGEAVRLTLPLG